MEGIVKVFIGVIGSGKDYQCGLLEKEGYTRIGFSDGVRNLTWKFLNWEPNNSIAYENFKRNYFNVFGERLLGRQILQRVGTIMREEDEDFWARKWYNTVSSQSFIDVGKICVSDCRYPNEVDFIKRFCQEKRFKLKIYFCNFKSERYELNDHESENLARTLLNKGYNDLDDITNFV